MTPPKIAEKLLAAGWQHLHADDWKRSNGDVHCWFVAEAIERNGWEHVPPPILPEPPAVRPPRKPGLSAGGYARRPRREAQPILSRPAHRPTAHHELAERILRMRDDDHLEWGEIATTVGSKKGRCMYLYKRARTAA